MLTIITILVIAFIFRGIWSGGGFEKTVAFLIFGLFIGFLLAIVLSACPEFQKEREWKVEKTQNIISIEDGSTISGQFFLGSGTIKDQLCFTFYRETENGFVFDKVSSSGTVIKETDGVPRIEWRRQRRVAPFYKSFVLFPPDREVIIYVPKGSIIRNFNLDSKI